MEINTKFMDSISYSQEDIIHFEDGLFGFEDLKDFVPVALEEGSDAILCLQCISDKDISFILMNPFLIMPDYSPVLSKEDLKCLGFPDESSISYYVISVIHDIPDECTINLKCPIAVNTATRQAYQVILDSPQYKFRHPLKEFAKKEG